MERASTTVSCTSAPLSAVLEVDMTNDCPLRDIDGEIREISVQHHNGWCRGEVLVAGEEPQIHTYQNSIGPECIDPVLHEHDCLPHIVDVDRDWITIMLYPPSREVLTEIIRDLRDQGHSVNLQRIVSFDEFERDDVALCDLSVLTDKERLTIERAIKMGYYDRNDSTDLEDLAEEFGVTKSAISHRLNSGERRIMQNILFG